MLKLVINNVHDTSRVMIVPTKPYHLRELAENMRSQDAAEISHHSWSINKVLWRSYKTSIINQTVLVDNKVAACFGLGGIPLGEVGVPWLLTSNIVYDVTAREFCRIYFQEVNKMLEIFPVLKNYVAAEYIESIKMLKLCGFTIGDKVIINNKEFFTFEKRRD